MFVYGGNMADYKGVKCPVCEIAFTDKDDIVVCPECGAPYHRDCYNKEGHCVFTENHEKGIDWEAPKAPVAPDTSAEIKDVECPVCGTLNAKSSLFCNVCGSSLSGEPATHNNRRNPSEDNPDAPPFTANPYAGGMPPFAGNMGFFFDPMAGISPTEMLDDNVTYGDASHYVRQNTQYYLPIFRQIKTFKKSKFNFAALLFSGGWLLYRKQYKLGTIFTAIIFLLYLGSILVSAYVTTPILFDMMSQIGLDPKAGVMLSSADLLQINDLLLKDMSLYIKFCSPLFFTLAILIVNIFVAANANRWYMTHCITSIQSIKSTATSEENTLMLEQKGGVNTSVAICLLVVMMILSYITRYI